MKHTRYAVKTENGYIRRKGSSYFVETTLDKADLYLNKASATKSAKSHKGKIILINIEEVQE